MERGWKLMDLLYIVDGIQGVKICNNIGVAGIFFQINNHDQYGVFPLERYPLLFFNRGEPVGMTLNIVKKCGDTCGFVSFDV